MSECRRIIIINLYANSEVTVIKTRKDILSEIKCNKKVAGRLTFDLLTQRSLFGSFFRLSFEYEVRSLAKIQGYCAGRQNVSLMSLIVTLTLEKLTT